MAGPIPTYQGQQIQPQSYQPPSVWHTREEAFGVGTARAGEALGKTLELGGNELMQHAIQWQQKLDTTNVIDAHTALLNDLQNVLYHPQAGLMNKEGKNAAGILQQYDQIAAQLQQKYASQMVSTNMQEAFARLSSESMLRMRGQIAAHEARQVQAGNERSIDLNVKSATESMPLSAFIDHVTNNIVPAMKQIGYKGYSPEDIDTIGKDLISSRAAADIKALIDTGDVNNLQQANVMLQQYKDHMKPTDYASISAHLTKQTTKINDYLTADNIVKAAMRQDGTVDRSLAYKLLEKQYGPGATKTLPGVSWQNIKSTAEKFLGQPYVWGGADPKTGFDCSGFTQYVYHQNGIELPRLANEQFTFLHDQGRTFTEPWLLKPGDLVFINTHTSQENDADNPYHITHVGIYAGDNKLLQSGTNGVGYVDLGDFKDVVAFGRPAGEEVVSTFNEGRMEAVKKIVDAKIEDINRIKKDQDQQYKFEIGRQINQAATYEDALKIINDSDLPLNTKRTFTNYAKAHFNALKPEATAEQAFWAHYAKNGFYHDYGLMQEFWNKQANGEDIEEKEQEKYNAASWRLNMYWQQATGGAYQPGQKTENERRADELFAQIKAQYPNATDDEIFAYLAQTLGYGKEQK